ncbi:AI-2E family transporter [Actinobacillus pleuropneumoniae]|uniref:Putative permease n=1 Tax=Actinobacillus pleuropneumoniae serotype 3 (strain JL03) TaxID=434271 RepID=B0BP43_ACTPJ|nr:AI-2E family transporter [Actinobacillus pleuropneumoniae]ABY69328.1 putative permease [Actinobacillus pleuropneumoniae serovar 3 str. JL03]EFM90121.1 Permease PerM [Actinobacillus pleuropneumoniae serovar 4 str. M62]KIE91305.1 putative permease [Actinobacillus pleuropneumoniae]KIE91762.1 putative permease [Actinobacillus pleuropneumoniae]KIE92052.1 putative permease [Actinobacillus pleuropneumoniae]
MFEMFQSWYKQKFNDPQTVALLGILLIGFGIIYFFSDLIMPLLIAIVFAYLLEWPIKLLTQKLKFPRLLSLILVLGSFISLSTFLFVVMLPTLWNQAVTFIRDLPSMLNLLNAWLEALPEHYPELIDYAMLDSLMNMLKEKILGFGESLLALSVNSIISLVGLGIYAFLVPLMVFFLLKDKPLFVRGFIKFLPKNRRLAANVWFEMQQQIANYIRGKVLEILIVGIVTYAIFLFFDLRYPLLLSVAVGLSVLIPYIGAVLVTIPVALVALFQFGLSTDFYYLLLAFVISQLLDGNLVVPFLFSEAVNLHPLTIIVAVLIFGGLWGFWGVFFAIPLATLVKAVINALPSNEEEV